jgi:hypothetical protein
LEQSLKQPYKMELKSHVLMQILRFKVDIRRVEELHMD